MPKDKVIKISKIASIYGEKFKNAMKEGCTFELVYLYPRINCKTGTMKNLIMQHNFHVFKEQTKHINLPNIRKPLWINYICDSDDTSEPITTLIDFVTSFSRGIEDEKYDEKT